MAVREYGQRSIRWRLGGAQFGPFDGGLNLRDSYVAVAPNELINGTNLTLDENGVAFKRNDCPTSASFPAPAGPVTASFYSVALSRAIIQVGSTLYKAALGAGAWTSFRTTSDTNVCGFVDFAGKLVYVHPTDGVRTYDGTTDAVGNAGVRGRVIATWQNKVYVCWGIPPPQYAPPYSATRVLWSAAGDPATWNTGTDFVDIREKDDKPVMALWPASGLLALKEDSTYRINDSTTGSYSTIDWQAGCIGARAITSSDGRIYFCGLDGIYASTGLAAAVNVSDKVRTLFSTSPFNATTKGKISAVALNSRVYFAFPRTSTTDCDEILEFNPRVGWFMEADLGGSTIGPMFTYLNSTGIVSASFSLASVMKDLFTGSTRTGFAFGFQTGWIEPFGGLLSRQQRLDITIQPAATAYGITLNYISMNGTGVGNPTWTRSPTFATGFQTRTYQPNVLGRAFQLSISDPGPSQNFRIFNARLDNLLEAIR